MSKHIRRRAANETAISVKLSDVASDAGVSTATVSRALNQPEKVRPSVLERVRASVDALGYVPHGAARALASQRSFTVGTIIPTFDNAIFARAIDALQGRLGENGYTLLLATSDYDPTRNQSAARRLIERGIDGMMLIGEQHHPSIFQTLEAKGLPYVVTWVYSPRSVRPCIGFSNHNAAFRMASYLVDVGHRRFGMIAGVTTNNDRATERVAGVRAALAARGADPGARYAAGTALRYRRRPPSAEDPVRKTESADGGHLRKRRFGVRRPFRSPRPGHSGSEKSVDRSVSTIFPWHGTSIRR